MTDVAARQRGEETATTLLHALRNAQPPPFEWVVEHVGPDGSLASVWAGATALQLVTLIEFARRPPRERVAAAVFGPRRALAALATYAPANSDVVTLAAALEAFAARDFNPALVAAVDRLTTRRRPVETTAARAVRAARLAWARKGVAWDAINLAEYAVGTIAAEHSGQSPLGHGYAVVSLTARREADAAIADQIRAVIAPPRLADVLPRVAKGRAKP